MFIVEVVLVLYKLMRLLPCETEPTTVLRTFFYVLDSAIAFNKPEMGFTDASFVMLRLV